MRMGKGQCLRKDFQVCALPVGAEISRLISSFNINDLDSPSRRKLNCWLEDLPSSSIGTGYELRATSLELQVVGSSSQLVAHTLVAPC
jgi:hypothetical protein